MNDLKLASARRAENLADEELDRRISLLLANYQAVTSNARSMGYLRFLLRHYAKSPTPWRDCYKDNLKRFGPDRTKGLCGVLKDLIRQNTHWRHGAPAGPHAKSAPFDVGAPGVAIAYADKGAANPAWHGDGHKLAEMSASITKPDIEGAAAQVRMMKPGQMIRMGNFAVSYGTDGLYRVKDVVRSALIATYKAADDAAQHLKKLSITGDMKAKENNNGPMLAELDMGEMAIPEEIALVLEDISSKCDIFRVLIGLDDAPKGGSVYG